SRRRHTRFDCDWSSDVCSSDLRPISASSCNRYPYLEYLLQEEAEIGRLLALPRLYPLLYASQESSRILGWLHNSLNSNISICIYKRITQCHFQNASFYLHIRHWINCNRVRSRLNRIG